MKGREGNPGLAKGAWVLYRCRLGRTKVRTNDKRKESEVYVVLIRLPWAQHKTRYAQIFSTFSKCFHNASDCTHVTKK
jgi:hypothetical protein